MAIRTDELLRLLDEGLTVSEMAVRLGVSGQRVSYLVKLRTGRGIRDRRPPVRHGCRCGFEGPRKSLEHRHAERVADRARQRSAATFWSHVVEGPGCWEYRGSHYPAGYAHCSFKGSSGYAHRAAYLLTKGPIPVGLTIDHLCRNRGCVNPAHLEAVTLRENLLRSPITVAGINARKTHCPRGHLLPDVGSRRERKCRVCARARPYLTTPDRRRRNNEASKRYRARRRAIGAVQSA